MRSNLKFVAMLIPITERMTMRTAAIRTIKKWPVICIGFLTEKRLNSKEPLINRQEGGLLVGRDGHVDPEAENEVKQLA